MRNQKPGSETNRRRFLQSAILLGSTTVLAACGQNAAPSPTSAPAAPAAPAAAPTATAAAAAAPAAVPTATVAIKAVSGGKLNVWFSANWNTVTDQAVGDNFTAWGKQNGVEVEWQSIPGTPQILEK